MDLSVITGIICSAITFNTLLFLSDTLTIYHKDWKAELKFRTSTRVDQVKQKQIESEIEPQPIETVKSNCLDQFSDQTKLLDYPSPANFHYHTLNPERNDNKG